jgi:hypothetical protein
MLSTLQVSKCGLFSLVQAHNQLLQAYLADSSPAV